MADPWLKDFMENEKIGKTLVFDYTEGKDPEACWVRLEGIQDGKMFGTVLTALRQDFGVKERNTVYFGMTEMEDHKLACVWVKEDE